jgi:hypothetical protein
VLVIICGHTPSSNVSPISSTIILGGLTNGSIWMLEMFIDVCCALGSGMMIQANGVFMLTRGSTSMGLVDYIDVS